ncbi:hypothetical protein GQ53DRAFT_161856 [Thozetella sp. PMI_491]|nr:hypothetical protein GQ53DRAFT_161856 [Thozetella sp. PMI_491]
MVYLHSRVRKCLFDRMGGLRRQPKNAWRRCVAHDLRRQGTYGHCDGGNAVAVALNRAAGVRDPWPLTLEGRGGRCRPGALILGLCSRRGDDAWDLQRRWARTRWSCKRRGVCAGGKFKGGTRRGQRCGRSGSSWQEPPSPPQPRFFCGQHQATPHEDAPSSPSQRQSFQQPLSIKPAPLMYPVPPSLA